MKRLPRLFLILTLLTLFVATHPALAASYSFAGNIASGPQYDLYTVELVKGEYVIATTHCDPAPNNTLDTILTVFTPGSDTSNTSAAYRYNDDGGSEVCGGFHNSVIGFGAPSTGTFTFRVDGFGSAIGGYSLNIVTGLDQPLSADGRINPDGATPVVVYCEGTTSRFFSVTGTDLGSVKNGGSGSFSLVKVSPLPDGKMQLTAPMRGGKTYRLVWDGCPKGTSYSYTIENGVELQFSNWSYDDISAAQGGSENKK